MVVADGRAGALDSVEDGRVVGLERLLVLHFGQEDEVQVRALRVAMAHVGGDDGVGQCVADLAHVKVHLLHIRPVDRALERIGGDAEVHERIAQVGVVESALFPALRDDARQGQAAVLEGDLGDVLCDVFGVALLAVGKAEEEAALHVLIAELFQQRIQRRIVDVIEPEHHARLLLVGQAEHGGIAALVLHHLARSLHRLVPGLEDVRKSLPVFGHPAEDLERDLGQDAEGALRAHHDLVEIRAAGLAGIVAGLYGADGRCVLLAEHDVGNAAVICAVLTRSARDRPAADGGILKALREVAAGVLPLCAEKLGRRLQRFLKVRAGHTRLDGDGLVDLIEGYDLVESLAHIQRYAALGRLDAARDGATATVDIQRDIVLGGVGDDLLDLLGRVGKQDDIGHSVDDLMAQAQDIVGRKAVGDCQAVVIGDGEALLADYCLECIKMLLCKAHGVVGQVDGVKADIVGIFLEVLVGELEGLLHHLIQRFLGDLEEFGIAPAEDGAVAVFRCGGRDPLGLKALVRLMTHQIMFLSFRLFIFA